MNRRIQKKTAKVWRNNTMVPLAVVDILRHARPSFFALSRGEQGDAVQWAARKGLGYSRRWAKKIRRVFQREFYAK